MTANTAKRERHIVWIAWGRGAKTGLPAFIRWFRRQKAALHWLNSHPECWISPFAYDGDDPPDFVLTDAMKEQLSRFNGLDQELPETVA